MIIKQLATEFNGQLECLGENIEKYIIFSAPIKKEFDNGKTITHKLKFVDSFRFMSKSLSSLFDNLSGIYSKKCIDKNCNASVILSGLKIISYIINATNVKKRQLKPINGLIKKFSNTYEFCNEDINRFILLLRKGVYPYEYMDSWERFDETTVN